MSQSIVRGYIKSILDGVDNAGIVHDYERWAIHDKDFRDLFTTTISGATVVRGWTITCALAPQEWLQEPEADGQGQIKRTYAYKIRGFFGIDDAAASEKTAWGIVEDALRALDTSGVLHGEDEVWTVNPPAQLTTFEPRLFAGVLCHYAEITQQVTEVITL